MNSSDKRRNEVVICLGPGCRAWDAEKLCRNLREQVSKNGNDIFVQEQNCQNNCGGGVTVRRPGFVKMAKIRDPYTPCTQILQFLSGN